MALQIQYGDPSGTPVVLAQFKKAGFLLKQTATLADPGATYTALRVGSDNHVYVRPTGAAEFRLAEAPEVTAAVLTTTGDMIYASSGSTAARLAIGSTNQGLYVVGGIPAWGASTKSTLTTTGDIVYASSANTLARLAVGSTNQQLLVVGGVPAWGASLQSLMTATGDIVYASSANTPARLAKGSDGNVLALSSGIPAWIANPSAGLGVIATTTVAGSVAATIDFTSIPGIYGSLMIAIQARGDVAATNTTLLVRLNNDSGANYDFEVNFANGSSTASGAEGLAQTSVQMGYITGNTGPASAASQTDIIIANYAGTTWQKTLTSRGSLKAATTTGNVYALVASGFWRSTAAVTRVTLFPGSGNFAIGTVCTLYGMA